MWVRQCDLDAETDFLPPIPSRIASNEEFVPPPQSAEQKEYEARLAEISERAAQAAGPVPPRLPPQRQRHGRGAGGPQPGLRRLLRGRRRRGRGPQGVRGEVAQGPVHLRRPDPPRRRQQKWYDDTPDRPRDQVVLPRCSAPRPRSIEHAMELLNRAHYVKEIFGDSDTVMAIISGVPSRDWDKNPLPPDQMVATRKFVNDLAGSRRVLSHGLLRPNLGKPELEEMERQVKELKIDAWKMYTGAEIGEKAWRMDDEKVAYPFWEKTKALGIKNLCVHKGLPLGAFNEEACRPLDLEKAAKDWPDLNFIVYHSGYRGFGWLASGTGDQGRRSQERRSAGNPLDQRHPAHPEAESRDQEHLLRAGQHVQHPVVRMRRELVHAHARPDGPGRRRRPHPVGHRLDLERQPAEPDRAHAPAQDRRRTDREVQYPQLTDEIKNQILGLNAARLLAST